MRFEKVYKSQIPYINPALSKSRIMLCAFFGAWPRPQKSNFPLNLKLHLLHVWPALMLDIEHGISRHGDAFPGCLNLKALANAQCSLPDGAA
jgi:hypothetical protein